MEIFKTHYSGFVLFFLFSFLNSKAQPIQNYSYMDCNNQTETVYDILGEGKPLIIASKGLDCSICMSQAPEVQTFTMEHPQVRVWGAMNNRYSQATPTCAGVNNWKNTYSWNDIFMFIDANDEWVDIGFPTYWVISPVDTTIIYKGYTFSEASSAALSLAPSGISSHASGQLCDVSFNNNLIDWNCPEISRDNIRLAIFNLQGKMVYNSKLSSGSIELDPILSEGMYLLTLSDKSHLFHSSKIIVD